MTPLQAQILRALDGPKRGLALSEALQDVPFRERLRALSDAQESGWITIKIEAIGMFWHRTPAGTEVLAGVTGEGPA